MANIKYKRQQWIINAKEIKYWLVCDTGYIFFENLTSIFPPAFVTSIYQVSCRGVVELGGLV